MHYTDEEIEKYRKSDGTISWGALAAEKLAAMAEEEKKNKSNNNVLDISELPIFISADGLCDKVWSMVAKWDYFAKKTIGDQIVRSADSVAANITEGYGRYHFYDYITFLYYARGSLYETKFWLEKARKRELVGEELYLEMKREYDKLPIELNKVIKVVKSQAYKWRGKPKYR